MAEFFASYGLFLAKIVTVLVAILIVMGVAAGMRRKPESAALSITRLNDRFTAMKQAVQAATLNKKQQKKAQKELKKQQKEDADKADRKRVFVINFEGDIKATAVSSLREEVTAILSAATEGDQVLVLLNNSGGVVHEHGLAASQLVRLKNANLSLTISVDKVAASGGYMMACVADKIMAAPFAIVGSIGVIAQLPNFNRLLDKHGVDYEQHTAGDYKRNVTMFGKNTDKEREQLKEQLEDIHGLFRGFVADYRPSLDIAKVSTGQYWYGQQALELGLVDELGTSDDHLLKLSDDHDIYQVKMERKKSMVDKITGAGASLVEQIVNRLATANSRQH